MEMKNIDFKIYGVKSVEDIEEAFLEINECEFCNAGSFHIKLQEVIIENSIGFGALKVMYKKDVDLKEKLTEIVNCEFCINGVEFFLDGAMFKNIIKTKNFNVTYQYSMIGTVTIEVPSNLSFQGAIEYAKENLEEIPLPDDSDYLTGSSILDEEDCSFEEA